MGQYTTTPAHFNRLEDLLPPLESTKQRLLNLILRVNEVCVNLRPMSQSEEDPMETDRYLQEAIELDSQLESWYQTLPPDWSFSIEPITATTNRQPWICDLLSFPGAPKIMHRYSLPLARYCTNLYNVGRLHLNLSMIDKLSSMYPAQQLDASFMQNLALQISSQIDAVMRNVPSALDISPSGEHEDPITVHDIRGMKAYQAMWPLIKTSKYFRRESVKMRYDSRGRWIKYVLEFLGRELSIKKASAYASLF